MTRVSEGGMKCTLNSVEENNTGDQPAGIRILRTFQMKNTLVRVGLAETLSTYVMMVSLNLTAH